MGLEGDIEFSKKSVLQILESAKNSLLLALDEAQHLDDGLKADFKTLTSIKNRLHEIHNGGFDRPLLFAVSGSGMTKDIFQKLGLSRFDDNST